MIKKRGRKSLSELTVATPTPNGPQVIERLVAPAQLVEAAEQEAFESVIDAMPVGSFGPEHLALLSQLARHTMRSDRVAQLISFAEKSKDDLDLNTYLKLLRAQRENLRPSQRYAEASESRQ